MSGKAGKHETPQNQKHETPQNQKCAAGTSGYDYNNSNYSTNNGMDGDSGFAYTPGVEATADNKIFLPSAFETLHMGNDKDTLKYPGYLNDPNSNAAENVANGNYGLGTRHGLWELNAYNRAFNNTITYPTHSINNLPSATDRVWLRSGYSNDQSNARRINAYGDAYYSNASVEYGVCPAIHLDLNSLMHRVTFDLNGTTGTSPETQTIVSGKKATALAATL